MSRGQIWTRAEFKRAKELLSQGLSYKLVAESLGRTDTQLHDKLVYESKSPEWHERKRNTINARRRAQAAARPIQVPRDPVYAMRIERAPAAVVIERDHRQSLSPRSLTALLCGDPLPGFSALERRA
jgi:hypothetical protein